MIPDKTNIRLKIVGREKEFFLSLDSRVSSVAFETEITLRKAPFQIQIIHIQFFGLHMISDLSIQSAPLRKSTAAKHTK